VSNSTFCGNHAIAVRGSSDAMAAVSALRRQASRFPAALDFGGGTLMLKNTIVANNWLGTTAWRHHRRGRNLSHPDTTCPGINSDPKLGPLRDNGGPTHTMALGVGSAARDAANDAICAAAPVNNLDQRGIARPQGPHCDIGAVEAILHPLFPPHVMRCSAASRPRTGDRGRSVRFKFIFDIDAINSGYDVSVLTRRDPSRQRNPDTPASAQEPGLP
jgi:hypothetical protein